MPEIYEIVIQQDHKTYLVFGFNVPMDLAHGLLQSLITALLASLFGVFVFYLQIKKRNQYHLLQQKTLLIFELQRNIQDLRDWQERSSSDGALTFLSLQKNSAISLLARGELTQWLTAEQKQAVIKYISVVDEVHYSYFLSRSNIIAASVLDGSVLNNTGLHSFHNSFIGDISRYIVSLRKIEKVLL